MTRKVVITGAGRGLGSVLADMATSAGDDVQATMRSPQKASDLQLDLDDPASIDALANRLGARLDCVDVLINNAGVDAQVFGSGVDERGPFDIDPDHFLATMRTNVVGPMLLTRALLPLLRMSAHAKIINVSAQGASMALGRTAGPDIAYNASKAAMNNVTVKTAHLLDDEGITTIALHPGWLKTDMGGDSAQMEVADGARQIWDTINGLDHAQNGAFLRYDGVVHPW